MSQALHILIKDIRGLRWELTVTVAVTLGMALLQLYAPNPALQAARERSQPLAVVAWVLLVVQLVQADALVGTEHDWRTRPIRRRDLVLAKVLFVALFIWVPMVVGDVMVLMGNGFAPLDYVPGLLWKSFWLSLVILLPAAAMGAITRTVPQALLAAVGAAIAVVVSVGVVYSMQTPWGGVDWVRGGWMGLAGSGVAAGVLALQYAKHRTTAARVLVTGGTGLVVLTTCLMPWTLGFGVQQLFAKQRMDGITVVPRLGDKSASSVRPRLSITALGLPDGYRAQVVRGRVTIDVDGERVETDAFAWDDSLFLEQTGHRDSPARMHATVWLAILVRQTRQEIDAKEESVRVAGLGICQTRFDENQGRPWASVFCRAPFRVPALSSVVLKTGTKALAQDSFSGPSGYSPMPSVLTLPPVAGTYVNLRHFGYGASPNGSRFTIETWTPVAYVERSFTVNMKRLGDYVTGGPGR